MSVGLPEDMVSAATGRPVLRGGCAELAPIGSGQGPQRNALCGVDGHGRRSRPSMWRTGRSESRVGIGVVQRARSTSGTGRLGESLREAYASRRYGL
jgi:hypothetical protein